MFKHTERTYVSFYLCRFLFCGCKRTLAVADVSCDEAYFDLFDFSVLHIAHLPSLFSFLNKTLDLPFSLVSFTITIVLYCHWILELHLYSTEFVVNTASLPLSHMLLIVFFVSRIDVYLSPLSSIAPFRIRPYSAGVNATFPVFVGVLKGKIPFVLQYMIVS